MIIYWQGDKYDMIEAQRACLITYWEAKNRVLIVMIIYWQGDKYDMIEAQRACLITYWEAKNRVFWAKIKNYKEA